MPDTDDAEGSDVSTREAAEAHPREDADDLRARARRIRTRSRELIDELGADHPLVAQALRRAEALELEADRPGHIDLPRS